MAAIYLNEKTEQRMEAKSRLTEVKKLENGKTLHRVKIMNGYVLTSNPEKWVNYEPLDLNYYII